MSEHTALQQAAKAAENYPAVLLEHQYLEAEAPFLYPDQSTVCACGTSPATAPPDSDWAWWVWHVSLIADGRTPAGYHKNPDGTWTKVEGEER